MKTRTKIIIFTCVILILIFLIILSSFWPKANQKKQDNNVNTNTNTNNPISTDPGGSEENLYVDITFDTTAEVFKIEGTDKTITVYQDFPNVSAEDETVKNKIQTELGKIANNEFEDYKKQVQKKIDTPNDIDAVYMEYIGNLTLKWSFTNNRNDKKVVSVKNESSGSLGGVGWDEKRGYSFSTETGELLTMKDIAVSYDALKKYVNEEIIKYFKANYQKLGIPQSSFDSLKDKIDIDKLTWYLSNSGLTICIPKDYVSPYTFEYTINYSDLTGLVKVDYLK